MRRSTRQQRASRVARAVAARCAARTAPTATPAENFATPSPRWATSPTRARRCRRRSPTSTPARVLVAIDDRIVLPTASIGKILLLDRGVGAADRARLLRATASSTRPPRDAVGRLRASGSTCRRPRCRSPTSRPWSARRSDNLATNVLLRQVGLDAVRARTESLGLLRTALLDLVRDSRGPDDAPQLSVGSTAELSWLFGALARGEIVDTLTSSRVLGWLSLNSDLSMVAERLRPRSALAPRRRPRAAAGEQDRRRCRGARRGGRDARSAGRCRLRGVGPVRRRFAVRAPSRSRRDAHGRVRPARLRPLTGDPQTERVSTPPYWGRLGGKRPGTVKSHLVCGPNRSRTPRCTCYPNTTQPIRQCRCVALPERGAPRLDYPLEDIPPCSRRSWRRQQCCC